MRSADPLILAPRDVAPATRARSVPGKTYEYLVARRPMLAGLPDGDARDLLTGWAETEVRCPAALGCMAHAARSRLERCRSGPTVPPPILDEYERGELAGRLNPVFDEVVGAAHRDSSRRLS